MRIRLKLSIYHIGVIVMFAMKSLGFDSTDKIYQSAMIGVTLVLLFNYIVQGHYEKNEFLRTIGLVAISALVTLISRQFAILATVIVIVASKNEDINGLLSKILWVHGLCLTITTIGWLIGIIPDYSTVMSKGANTVYAYSFGYRHPNIAGLQAMLLLLLQLFNKRNVLTYGYSFAVAIIVSALSQSRTSLYLSIFIMCSFMIFDVLNKRNKLDKLFYKFKKALFWYPIIMAGISLSSVYLYKIGNTLAIMINAATSGRIQLSARYLEKYSVPLLGQMIASYGNEGSYLRLDNGYLNILLRFGIIVFVIFIFSQMSCLKIMSDEKRYFECLIIVIFLTYGLIETYIYNVFVNFSLLYLSELIYPSKNKMRDKYMF